jgi:uncharacterized membrane protein YqjE
MADVHPANRQTSLMDALARLIDGVQLLVREHLQLARVEVKHDLRALARNLAPALLGAPVLLSGWLLLMMAVAFALPLPAWAACGIVALANLALGAALVRAGLQRLVESPPVLPRTAEELKKDTALVAQIAQGSSPGTAPTPSAKAVVPAAGKAPAQALGQALAADAHGMQHR